MTFARDMSNMRDERHFYYRSIAGVEQLAVGWLAGDCPSVGTPPVDFRRKLARWIATQKSPSNYLGFYQCALPRCPDDKGDGSAARGTGEIYVPHVSKPKTLFCAPRLIEHYVVAHGYSPPGEFIESVLACSLKNVPKLESRVEELPDDDAGPGVVRSMTPDLKPVRLIYVWLNEPEG